MQLPCRILRLQRQIELGINSHSRTIHQNQFGFSGSDLGHSLETSAPHSLIFPRKVVANPSSHLDVQTFPFASRAFQNQTERTIFTAAIRKVMRRVILMERLCSLEMVIAKRKRERNFVWLIRRNPLQDL